MNVKEVDIPESIVSVPQEGYSEVVVEERNSFITETSVIAPSEYNNPEYEILQSTEKKINLNSSLNSGNEGM